MWRKYAFLALSVIAFCFGVSGPHRAQGGNSEPLERVEVRNTAGEVITTIWPESRNALMRFADTVAREYKLPMHTHRLEDGVAIQLGPRNTQEEGLPPRGLDREVNLTLRNGRMRRTWRLNESELRFYHLAEVWSRMGYGVSCSTASDHWWISRDEYVSPEVNDARLRGFLDRFTKAVLNRETSALSELFASKTHFPSGDERDRHDRIVNHVAGRRFLREYSADDILLCYESRGVEGQGILVLAGRTGKPVTKEWFLCFWIVEQDGDYVITQVSRASDFWAESHMKSSNRPGKEPNQRIQRTDGR